MFRTLTEIEGFKLDATDGSIGKCKDFLFDDRQWTVRYMVADTGGWLTGRKVLISPAAIQEPAWEEKRLPVDLTRKKIEDSPGIDEHAPVSRKREAEVSQYFDWPNYWSGMTFASGGFYPPQAAVPGPIRTRGGDVLGDEADPVRREQRDAEERDDETLRSANEVKGYSICTRDGHIGHVADYIADEDWKIRYIVIDTGNLLSGREVLLSPAWIKEIVWSRREVVVDLETAVISEAPDYNGVGQLGRAYEKALHEHYQRTPYWDI